MRRRIVTRAVAWRDLSDHAAFIARDSARSALRFLKAAESSFKLLAGNPALGAPYDAVAPALSGARRFRVRGFENYLIFYLPVENGIEVVRVVHGARDIEALFDE